MPARLLNAIADVETGRPDPRRGVIAPWPWSVDADGAGRWYASRQEAVAAVQAAQSAGAVSIDVGCMQINLRSHPDAFASLDEAFDPAANAAFAARFLVDLHRRTGSWPDAAAAYHSQAPGMSDAYRERVMAAWPEGADDEPPASGSDPLHVLTPEFRRRLVQDAAFSAARDASMLGAPPRPGPGGVARRMRRLQRLAMREAAER